MGRGEFRTIALEMEASYGERRVQNHCYRDGGFSWGEESSEPFPYRDGRLNIVEIIACKLDLF